MSLDFAVVKFEDGTVSEVPRKWLVGNSHCWWPNTRNAAPFITKLRDPDFTTWDKYEVVVEVLATTLEKARKKASDLEYTTSEECDENIGKGKRTPKKKNFGDFDDYENNSTDTSSSNENRHKITSPPKLDISNELITNSEIIHSSSVVYDNIDEIPVIIDHTNDMSSYNSCEKKIEKILDAVLELKMEIKALKEAIENTGEIALTNNILDGGVFKTIIDRIPIQDLEELKSFEDFLLNDENQVLFKKFLNSIGGMGPKDNIYRILKKIFSDEVAVTCSWMGQRNNYKVSDLTSIKFIGEIIFYSHQMREKEFETISSEWFRHARQRLNRKNK